MKYDEQGSILDGRHRVRAYRELGIAEWRKVVAPGLSEEEKLEHTLRANLLRRQVTQEQKREIAVKMRKRG